uniref:Uncharacterized protein n=1 Tax=Arundo donax TaxID=35708 RepID=A0A0A9GXH0_ARUDO
MLSSISLKHWLTLYRI